MADLTDESDANAISRAPTYLTQGFLFTPCGWLPQRYATEHNQPLGIDQGSGLQLIRAYLDSLQKDPDSCFALDQAALIRPFADLFPESMKRLREGVAQESCEIVGHGATQLQSNLTDLEVLLRNLCFGQRSQNRLFQKSSHVGWLLESMGHDPSLPQILNSIGMQTVLLRFGVSHPNHREEEILPPRFRWIGPSGSSVLVHRVPMDLDDILRKLSQAHTQEGFERVLNKLSETYHGRILPLTGRFRRPFGFLSDTVRGWNKKHPEARFALTLPTQGIDEIEEASAPALPTSRLMGPVFTGTGVTHMDLKLAHRRTSLALTESELWASLAATQGDKYPALPLDWVARTLVYASHPDALGGIVSDQTYIDLMAMMRAAWDVLKPIEQKALTYLAQSSVDRPQEQTSSLVIFNSCLATRSEEIEIALPEDFHDTDFEIRESADQPIAYERIDDGRTIRLMAQEVPGLGTCHFQVWPKKSKPPSVSPGEWEPMTRPTILENQALELTIDPARGGAITSITDRRSDQDLLRSRNTFGGNLIVEIPEYPDLPGHGEGLKHLTPKGESIAWKDAPVEVLRRRSPLGDEVRVRGHFHGTAFHQSIRVLSRIPEVRFTTWIHPHGDQTRRYQILFPARRLGRRPLYETRTSSMAGPFSVSSTDVASHPWTQNFLGYRWAGWASTCTIHSGQKEAALGVLEIIPSSKCQRLESRLTSLITAFVDRGVSATLTQPDGSRMGIEARDPHAQDTHFVIMTRDDPWPRQLPSPDQHFAPWPPPVDGLFYFESEEGQRLLVLFAHREDQLDGQLKRVIEALEQRGTLEAHGEAPRDSLGTNGSFLLLNRGQQSYSLAQNGDIGLDLLRSTSAWPSGTWFDGPSRALPDGSSFAMNTWSHRLEYALLVGPRDPQSDPLCLSRIEAWDRPLRAVWGRGIPSRNRRSFLSVTPPSLSLSAAKLGETQANALAIHEGKTKGALTLRLVDRLRGAKQIELTGGEVIGPLKEAVRLDATERPLDKYALDDGLLRISSSLGQIHTLSVRFAEARAQWETASLGRHPHPARYWDLNIGPVPVGCQAFHLAVEPRTLEMEPGEKGTISALITHRRTDSPLEGQLSLRLPEDWDIARKKTRIQLSSDTHRRFRLSFAVPSQAKPGWEWIRVQLLDNEGFGVDDFVAVKIGETEEEKRPFALRVMDRTLYLRPGKTTHCRVMLTNPNRTELRVSLGLVTSFACWDWVRSPRRRIPISPLSSALVDIPLHCPIEAQDSHFFGMIKAVGGGQCLYSESLLIAPIRTARITLRDKPTRLRRLQSAVIHGEYASPEPIHPNTKIGIRLPMGFSSKVIEREALVGYDEIARIRFAFEVHPPGQVATSKPHFEILARAPRKRTIRVSVEPVIAPLLHAPRLSLARDTDDLLQIGMSSAEWTMASSEEDRRWRDREGGLRIRMQAGWDKRKLYLVAETKGCIPFNDRDGPDIVLGDCLRMTLNPSPSTTDLKERLDLVLALARGRPKSWCFRRPSKATARDDSWLEFDAHRARGGVRYAMILNLQPLGFAKPKSQNTMGFSFAAFTDSGAMKREIAEWTPGTALGRRPDLFGSLRLDD